jgi:RHS repeat-associated protein
MTLRHVGVDDHTFAYNEENKLTEVELNGVTQATYTYDGDGTLVKKVVGGQTTVYVGNHFEKNLSTNTSTKYYYLGNRRVAMRTRDCQYPMQISIITHLHGDHLGSASLTTDIYGGVNDEMRYYPYGEARSGSMATDRRFTGQREETAIGLYDYRARYYDPVLGRFIQADTIVPEPGNPQALNRYAYTLNSPLRYTDPSGHCPALIGAAIGGVFGLGAYAITTDSFDAREAMLVTATMAGAGALIGTGVGAAAGAQLASTILIGSGVGMAAGGGSEMLANTVTDQEFSSIEFVTSAAGGAVSGAATAVVPGVGLAPAATRAGITGSLGALQYSAEQALTDKTITVGGTISAFSSAALGQILGEGISTAAYGTPSQKAAMLRLSVDDFGLDSAGSSFSPLFYESYPEMKEIMQVRKTGQALGEVGRDTLLNTTLDTFAY